MKIRSLIFGFISFCVLTLFIYSCKSDDYEEWRMMNDNWYNRARIAYSDSAGYNFSQTGLIYKILEPGYQRRPNDNSLIYVTYSGNFITGTVFDSGDSTLLYMSTAVPGWREALKLIQDGGHIKFIIPYSLGYGSTDTGLVPPYSTLIFDVKLYRSTN